MRDFPVRAWIYTAGIALGALLSIRLMEARSGLQASEILIFGLLIVLVELVPISFPHTSYSVSFVVVLAALVGVGPAEAGVAASFAAFDLALRERPDWLGRMFFNGAQFALSASIAGWIYVTFSSGKPVVAGSFPEILLPVVLSTAGFFVTNSCLVSLMVALVRRVRLGEVWRQNYSTVLTGVFGFSLIGLLLGTLYQDAGVIAVLFVIVPLLMARRALESAAQMDAAYEATLRSLVTAIEAKDAYTRGHAERVSQLAAMIAREMGFPERNVRALRIAALMHDVGKLVVSTPILTKPGKLTPEEYEHMKSHPVHGCEVIGEIDFLRSGEAVNAVRHHHERLDGRGYPDGLFGDEVPLTARIVMTADAFDSMTSTRTYRKALSVETAMRELRRCSVTQFDPVAIAALDAAIKKHGWEPTPELYRGEQVSRSSASVHAGL